VQGVWHIPRSRACGRRHRIARVGEIPWQLSIAIRSVEGYEQGCACAWACKLDGFDRRHGRRKTTRPFDVGAVLRAVAKHYCAEYKPDTPVLSAKISILKDGLDSREMLLEYSRDQAAVDQYFTVNRQGLELPADVNYGCFRLSHGNGGRFG